jgi:hypothetical protein
LTAGPVTETPAAGLSDNPAGESRRLPAWADFVLIRLGFMLLTAFTVLRVPEQGNGIPAFTAWGKLPSVFFDTFEHWDADLFLTIARDGYDRHLAAFMPVYPGLVHLGGWITRSNVVAAVVISLAAATAGVYFTSRIASRLTGEPIARDTALLLALYPVSFVFTAPYSEGLFLGASAGAVLYCFRGKLWIAGLLAGVAVDTRVLGLALIPAMLIVAWPAARKRGLIALVPLVALPLAAFVAIAAYYQHAVGDSLAFLHAQKTWGRHVNALGPLDAIWRSAKATYNGIGTLAGVPGDPGIASLATENVIDFVLLVVAIALTVVVFRRLGTALGAYSTGLLLIATAAPVTDGGEVLQSMPRFLLVDFPLFIAGASLLRDAPARRGPVFGILTALGAVACVTFSRKLWVA